MGKVCALISAVKQSMNLYNHTSHKEGRCSVLEDKLCIQQIPEQSNL